MLRLLALSFGLLLANPALAQAVRVTSGDHPDFTRIVLEFPGPVDWQIGRTADGYELRLPGDAVQYDLSGVFDLIQKDRLAAIWADPESKALHFSIACACFAMPFEFRPGTIVIDIRNGEPPKGSSFELALDGGAAGDLVGRPIIRPPKRPGAAAVSGAAPEPTEPRASYDWTTRLLDTAGSDGPQALGAHLSDLAVTETAHLDLAPLRQSLIEQLSRGASQGIVDMAKPRKAETATEEEPNPSVEIRLGDAPNLVIRQKGEEAAPLTAEGAECVEDERLAVAEWAGETPIVDQIGPILSGLVGEFDKPDPEAIRHAIQFYLNLGFGAEARSLLRAFPVEHEDAAIWTSMARLLDGQADPDSAFAGMAACDTAAALWAVLSDPQTLAVGQVERSAILRAFSALPNHLRRQLGPILVDRFLEMQDFPTAIALRDAVLRGGGEAGADIELMQAAIDHAGGSASASQTRLEEVAAESGPKTAEALVALVVQRAELGQEVSFDQVQALEEYTSEREGSVEYPEFSHALTLGYAASGDFKAAFDRVADDPKAAPVLWQILATSGPDSALLDFATLAARQDPPPAATGAASLVATRMLTLGLADQAERWLDLAEAPPVLLTARVRLAAGQPQEALDLVSGDTSKPALAIRIGALQALGDSAALAGLFAQSGMTEEQWRTVTRMQDWDSLAAEGPEVWKQAAEKLVGADDAAADTGPLAAGQALLSDSAETRDAINALLDSVKTPGALTQ